MDTWAGQGVNWTWNNGQDVARIGFGVFDVGLGASMIWTGAGTLPGIGLIAIGLDQLATGAINLRYGRIGQGFSIIEFGAYSATGNEPLAFLTPGVFSLGFGSLGSVGRLGARAGGLLEGPGGLTMLGGSPRRLASTQAQLDGLYQRLIQVANSTTFMSRAKKLGFTEGQLSQLPGEISRYHEFGLLGWIRTGGWVDKSNLLIGRGGLFSQAGRMRHEHGHLLDEIARPGLMTLSQNPRAFGFMGFFRAEMVAFGTLYNRFNPARPWLSGLTASHNRFGYWGSIPFAVGSASSAYELETRLLDFLYGP